MKFFGAVVVSAVLATFGFAQTKSATFTGNERGLSDEQRKLLKEIKVYKNLEVAIEVAKETGKPVAYWCSESRNPLDSFKSAKARATALKLGDDAIHIADTNSRSARGNQEELVDKTDRDGKKLEPRVEVRNVSNYDGKTGGIPYIPLKKLDEDSAEKLLVAARK